MRNYSAVYPYRLTVRCVCFRQFQQIYDTQVEEATPVGVLTSNDRDTWAKASTVPPPSDMYSYKRPSIVSGLRQSDRSKPTER